MLRVTPSPAADSAVSPLLQATGLSKRYPLGRGHHGGWIEAVAEVELSLHRGETLGLVGESGCGKSTLARLVALLEAPDRGQLTLAGTPITGVATRVLKSLRRRVQLVFQDPYAALNPRLPIGFSVAEPLLVQGLIRRREWRHRAAELLAMVGLDAAAVERYPHAFSGGQRQRIAIARALALRPALLVADEPVAALDVSIQSQILNLLAELREQLGIACLFISHDLAVVDHIADRVAVMYLGRIVESGPRERVLSQPAHPYTRALLDALPPLQSGRAAPPPLPVGGEVPDPSRPPAGCPYHPRCPQVQARCRELRPEPTPVCATPAGDEPNHTAVNHTVACHYPLSASAASDLSRCAD